MLSVIAYFSMWTGQRCEALSEKILIKPVDQTQDRPSTAGKVSWIYGDYYYQGACCFARICLWGAELWGL